MPEAYAASILDRNCICTNYEVDLSDEWQLFIIMVCYDCEILKQIIERRRIKIDEAIDIAL